MKPIHRHVPSCSIRNLMKSYNCITRNPATSHCLQPRIMFLRQFLSRLPVSLVQTLNPFSGIRPESCAGMPPYCTTRKKSHRLLAVDPAGHTGVSHGLFWTKDLKRRAAMTAKIEPFDQLKLSAKRRDAGFHVLLNHLSTKCMLHYRGRRIF